MMPITALAIAKMFATTDFALRSESESIAFGSFWWFTYAGISCVLVLFAGIMSGLTLGLMSLGLVELEILQRSGTAVEKKQAAAILPVVQKQHQLLVTLLLCNACAMEALPICLDKIFHPFVAVILSVTFVLAFGEVIPQAICTRYGLAVGANFVWLVRILMVVCYPVAYPIGKLLDCVLGHNESALFRRAQLKALVSIHSKEAGKGGELTHDETTIISGALDLTEKTAEEAMTPIESTFSLDVNSKLDWEAIGKILARGHSRVPVYSGNPKNIIGLLLVKSLLTVRAETETPVSAVSIRRIPRVPADMPLYDILNEFQKGSSHMAAVVKSKGKSKYSQAAGDGQKSEDIKVKVGDSTLTTPFLLEEKSDSFNSDIEKGTIKQVNGNSPNSIPQNNSATGLVSRLTEDVEDGEVIGIITLEDVFEELLQEEIVDETDEYVDVHKRIRVAAAAAASSMARAPSIRRLTGQKAMGAQTRPANTPKKSSEDDSSSVRNQFNPGEPLVDFRLQSIRSHVYTVHHQRLLKITKFRKILKPLLNIKLKERIMMERLRDPVLVTFLGDQLSCRLHKTFALLGALQKGAVAVFLKRYPAFASESLSVPMGYSSVFSFLREVFPQVDFRILKAVAFEHSEDADAAAEFILSEVLPVGLERLDRSLDHSVAPTETHADPPLDHSVPPTKTHADLPLDHSVLPTKECLDPSLELRCENGETSSQSTALAGSHVEFKISSISCARGSLREDGLCGNPGNEEVVSLEKHRNDGSCKDASGGSKIDEHSVVTGGLYFHEQIVHDEKDADASFSGNQHLDSSVERSLSPGAGRDVESKISSVSCAHGGLHVDQLCVKSGNEEIVSFEMNRNAGFVTDGPYFHEQTVDDEKDPDALSSGSRPLDSPIEESLPPAVQQIQSPVEETVMISEPCTSVETIHSGAVNNCEKPRSKGWKEDTEESIFDAEMVQVDNESLTTSSSSQIISVDLLEEFITEAKEYKKNLSSEIEVLMDMAREVEFQEKAANEAKVEASKVGLDIFAKVDELKEMLQRAKLANDMHAGEVSGEKSILATEARELQSRLLNLSDKREKSLLIVYEIRENLKARLAEAEALKAMAEQEKLQKEESARQALTEQEHLMDMVVQESNRIQEEAEENAKLQDFLVDRGRVVDMLQGEIAVICEDVKMLKERVESRLPIGRGLSMSQIGGALTSSYKSFRSMSPDRAPELSKSSESVAKSNIDLLSSEPSVGSDSSKRDMDGGKRTVLPSSSWYKAYSIGLYPWSSTSDFCKHCQRPNTESSTKELKNPSLAPSSVPSSRQSRINGRKFNGRPLMSAGDEASSVAGNETSRPCSRKKTAQHPSEYSQAGRDKVDGMAGIGTDIWGDRSRGATSDPSLAVLASELPSTIRDLSPQIHAGCSFTDLDFDFESFYLIKLYMVLDEEEEEEEKEKVVRWVGAPYLLLSRLTQLAKQRKITNGAKAATNHSDLQIFFCHPRPSTAFRFFCQYGEKERRDHNYDVKAGAGFQRCKPRNEYLARKCHSN
ncbi:hypothetical protein H6P81_001916 [Aristolochia fimbriata]|uniref:CNNM transmembrane domain-containing protein n=3 Tax=Magnoliopsida TaxID=3398 RepID=A0AAV7F8X4_ARIFI|nr:hypothetical protein H6P81_001916 [Aristolochia fimbriata]